MLAKIPERYMHLARWVLAIGWLVLIVSLFYDPISTQWTSPGGIFVPDANPRCTPFQDTCIPRSAYPMGARIFWSMVVPSSILILLFLGHETWRRICPLSFMSQIPRALGWQRKLVIRETSWLHRNHALLQFGLLFVGLNLRLLLANSDRGFLAGYLLLTIAAAITVGFLFDGKTWCHYFCPMATVQTIYSQPSGLLGSKAHTAPSKSITQSMCRTTDPRSGQEKSSCVGCKTSCMDIDAERPYWENIHRPDQKIIRYGYVGLVIGFFLYFWLYSGHWNFIATGVWNEVNQVQTLLQPGFYFAGRSLPIPKLIAVPFTLTVFPMLTYSMGLWAERIYKRRSRFLKHSPSPEEIQNRAFAIATFIAFNCLFFLGMYPSLSWLPSTLQRLISWLAILGSTLWLVKTWRGSYQQYLRERDTNLLRRQLSKFNVDFSQCLDGRTIDDLKPDELYTLVKVIPGITQQGHLRIYTEILHDALEQHSISVKDSLIAFRSLRHRLAIDDESHWKIVDKLQVNAPHLFTADYSARPAHSERLPPASDRLSNPDWPFLNFIPGEKAILKQLLDVLITDWRELQPWFDLLQKTPWKIGEALNLWFRPPEIGDAVSQRSHGNSFSTLSRETSATEQREIQGGASKHWTQGELTVRCVRVKEETADVKTFSFVAEPPLLFTYKPGQFVTLELEINGETILRSYSISSTPSRPHLLEITVKRVPPPPNYPTAPPGLVSNWLHDHLTVGHHLKLKGPYGKFTCLPYPPAKLLLISAGSGITPMMSMSRWITDTATESDLIFFHSARSAVDIIFRQELELLAAGFPNFHLAITITQAATGQSWFGFTGRITAQMLQLVAPDFQERTVYVCGPESFMAKMKAMFVALEFPMQNYYEESFGSSKMTKQAAKGEAQLQASAKKIATGSSLQQQSNSRLNRATGVVVTQTVLCFAQSGQEVTSDGEETILTLAELEGIKLRSGCRQGVCGVCKAKKLEGEVRYEADPDGLDADELAAGYILTCIACPVGRVIIDV